MKSRRGQHRLQLAIVVCNAREEVREKVTCLEFKIHCFFR